MIGRGRRGLCDRRLIGGLRGGRLSARQSALLNAAAAPGGVEVYGFDQAPRFSLLTARSLFRRGLVHVEKLPGDAPPGHFGRIYHVTITPKGREGLAT